jgi:hypothetical protein
MPSTYYYAHHTEEQNRKLVYAVRNMKARIDNQLPTQFGRLEREKQKGRASTLAGVAVPLSNIRNCESCRS